MTNRRDIRKRWQSRVERDSRMRVNDLIVWVYVQRKSIHGDSDGSRLIFCAPRIKVDWDKRWHSPLGIMAAVIPLIQSEGKFVPSMGYHSTEDAVIMPLRKSVIAVEWSPSQKDLQRLMDAGIIVIRQEGRGFNMRFPNKILWQKYWDSQARGREARERKGVADVEGDGGRKQPMLRGRSDARSAPQRQSGRKQDTP